MSKYAARVIIILDIEDNSIEEAEDTARIVALKLKKLNLNLEGLSMRDSFCSSIAFLSEEPYSNVRNIHS